MYLFIAFKRAAFFGGSIGRGSTPRCTHLGAHSRTIEIEVDNSTGSSGFESRARCRMKSVRIGLETKKNEKKRKPGPAGRRRLARLAWWMRVVMCASMWLSDAKKSASRCCGRSMLISGDIRIAQYRLLKNRMKLKIDVTVQRLTLFHGSNSKRRWLEK